MKTREGKESIVTGGTCIVYRTELDTVYCSHNGDHRSIIINTLINGIIEITSKQ